MKIIRQNSKVSYDPELGKFQEQVFLSMRLEKYSGFYIGWGTFHIQDFTTAKTYVFHFHPRLDLSGITGLEIGWYGIIPPGVTHRYPLFATRRPDTCRNGIGSFSCIPESLIAIGIMV